MSRDLVVALSGGIGGAKLALGLSRILPADNLLVVANVGDDFEHLGLHISPDLDTVMYTLAGIANPDTGWGLKDETWNFMAAVKRLGGPTWFRLGDGDLATHVERSRRLAQGETLSAITADMAAKLGITLDQIIGRLLSKPPEALRETQRLLRHGAQDELLERMQIEGGLFAERLKSPEVKEAITAFFEKRKPDFSKR